MTSNVGIAAAAPKVPDSARVGAVPLYEHVERKHEEQEMDTH